MEHPSDASPLHYFLLSIPPSPRSPNAEVVHRDLTRALGLPHGEEFILVDLRKRKDDRAFLIGFDGVGKYGNDKYSACLNVTLGLGGER